MAAELRVGPHGYEHGWIFVGVPGVGASVFHPHHGHGVVTGVTDGKAQVKFGAGQEVGFPHHGGTGEGRLAPPLPQETQDRITQRLTALRVERDRRRDRYDVVAPGGVLISSHPDRKAAQQAIKDRRSLLEAQAYVGQAREYLKQGDTTKAGHALDAADALTTDPQVRQQILSLMHGMTFNPGQYRPFGGASPQRPARPPRTETPPEILKVLRPLSGKPSGRAFEDGPNWPDLGTLVARTAETPVASTVHEPFGSPAGPGLFHHKGLQLPAYVQHVAHHLVAQGHSESNAIQMAVGIIKNWAAGHDGHGNAVHPDVQAAAVKALAEWEAAKAASKSSGRSAGMAHEHRAQMATQSINDLPDSAFAYIEPGGTKDSSGKTVPRSLRHFPVHDKAHAANALSRAPQSPFGEKAMPKIRAAAKKFGIDAGGDDSGGRSFGGLMGEAERRFTPGAVEVRSGADGQRIGGYGAVFGKLSRNLGGFVERVGSGAFSQSRSLGWPNVVCRYNHDPNMVLGTTAGGTLQMRTDNVGLDYEVLPPQARADIVELVQRRDIQFSSFAFRVPPGGDEWSVTDQNYPMRTLHEVQLVDVAPVLDPAYPDATAGLRSLAAAMDAPLEDVVSLAAADELRKFFVRTDNRGAPVKPKPTLFAPAAAVALLARRTDPWE